MCILSRGHSGNGRDGDWLQRKCKGPVPGGTGRKLALEGTEEVILRSGTNGAGPKKKKASAAKRRAPLKAAAR